MLTPDGKYAFCLEKSTIFKKSDLAQKKHVEQELKNALGVEEILWLPKQPNDNIGHIDGYIQFLGNFLIEGTVELYNDLTSGSLLDSGGINKLYEYVKDKNIVDCLQEWIYLFCSDNDTDWLSAKGLYINFLETSKAVFVPQFNLPLDENAIKTLKLHTAKPIIKVDCSEIAKYGGAVHCFTKNYFL